MAVEFLHEIIMLEQSLSGHALPQLDPGNILPVWLFGQRPIRIEGEPRHARSL